MEMYEILTSCSFHFNNKMIAAHIFHSIFCTCRWIFNYEIPFINAIRDAASIRETQKITQLLLLLLLLRRQMRLRM